MRCKRKRELVWMDNEKRHSCAIENTFGHAPLHPAIHATASMCCQRDQVTRCMGAYPLALSYLKKGLSYILTLFNRPGNIHCQLGRHLVAEACFDGLQVVIRIIPRAETRASSSS